MTCILVPCAGMQLCNDRMPSGHGSQLGCLCRWDGCWIRLLDGMLQLSVAGTRDYELRVPTRIRSIVHQQCRRHRGRPDLGGRLILSAPLGPAYASCPPETNKFGAGTRPAP